MNWRLAKSSVQPFAAHKKARGPAPFNVSRWFAVVGLLSISVVSTASALMLSHLMTTSMLSQEGTMSRLFVQSIVKVETTLGEFLNGEPSSDPAKLKAAFEHIATMPDTLRANIYSRERVLIWSTDQNLVGRKFGDNDELEDALAGEVVVHGDAEDDGDHPRKEEHVDLNDTDFFVEVYVPIRNADGGPVLGVIELYKNPRALGDALRTGRLYIFGGAALAGLFLYLALFGLSRRADTVMRNQQNRLVESEILATVGEMGSAVAHGIRNPLAAIRSSAELALDSSAELAGELARDIIAEADRLEEWVRNLLTYSRPVGGAMEAVSLTQLVDRTINHFAREMEKRGIAGHFSVSPDLPHAKGDALLLGQVLHTLVANAVEAIQQGGRIEIGGEPVPHERLVNLTIRDTGPGMTPEQLQRLFTPFYTTKPAGMGVGLTLAKRIIERFGGRIAIESAPGQGTAVKLSMPIA